MQEAGRSAAAAPALEAAIARRTRRSWLSQLLMFGRKYPLGAFGGVALILMVFVAVFANQLSTHDPLQQDIPNRLQPPLWWPAAWLGQPAKPSEARFLLGTDTFGRDAFSRILHGSRISLYVGLLSVLLGSTTGVLLGVASAYLAGSFDLAVQRLVDTLMGMPALVIAMIMVVALGASLNNVMFAIALSLFPRMVRLSRSAALSVKEEVYVLAAQAIGAGRWRVMLQHILPNTLAPAFVLATGYLGTAIVAEASLSFLGLGVPPPHASWGSMLELGARGHLESAPWLAIFPGVALSIAVFAFSFLGDALRDAFDPRLRGR